MSPFVLSCLSPSFLPCVSVCVYVWWFKSSYMFISLIFWLFLNWCDQQIAPFKNDTRFVSHFLLLSDVWTPASHQVCSLLFPSVGHHVLCWWSLADIFAVYSHTLDICLSHAMTWHWQCFLVSSDKELAFWYLLSSLLWEWHLEEEVTLET